MFINMANLFQNNFLLICVLQNIVGVTYILHPQLPLPYKFNDPLGVENEVDIIGIIRDRAASFQVGGLKKKA